MIQSNLPRRRGRPPAVTFPITRTVVEQGLPRVKTMEAGTEVLCLRCSMPFRVDRFTAYLTTSYELDDMPYIRCPRCCYTAPVIYYFDRVTEIGPMPDRNAMRKARRIRTPEDLAPEIETPEDL